MSQIDKLKALQSQQKQSNLTVFNGLVVVNVGVEPVPHFPKLRDEAGNKVKDEKGSDRRSETSDGWTYTFAEFGTGKTVKIVYPKLVDLELLTAYKVAGLGYDIKKAGLIFIDQGSKIANY